MMEPVWASTRGNKRLWAENMTADDFDRLLKAVDEIRSSIPLVGFKKVPKKSPRKRNAKLRKQRSA